VIRALSRPLSPLDLAKGYLSLLNRSLRANFAYRSTTVMGLLTAALSYALTMLVWKCVYDENPGTVTIPHAQMFSYLALAFCVNYAISMNVENRVGQRIRMGLIATDLLKPVDFQTAQAVQALADGLFNSTLGVCVFACSYLLLGPSILPASPSALGAFAVSLLLAFLIHYGICFLFIQGAFFVNNGYGIFAARFALHQTFSGLSAPLTLYPPVLKTLGAWLPFQHVIYTPISIYTGALQGQAVFLALGRQALWALALFLGGKFLMTKALKQFEVQGG